MLLDDCNDDECETTIAEASTDLVTLSELILGDSSSTSCYATRAILTSGVEQFCFKEIANKNTKAVGAGAGAGTGVDNRDRDRGPMYEPRQVHIVDTMRNRAKVEANEAAKWEDLKQRIYNSGASQSFIVENETEEVQIALKSLERLGCMANLIPDEIKREEKVLMGNTNSDSDANELAAAKQFLQNIDRRATPEVARQLLVSLGIWNKHTNLDIIRLKVRTTFDAYLEDAAVDIALHPPPDLDESLRLDLTHLPSFAIDAASTKEIDDALSVEMVDNRQRLWVHIADPTRYIELGSPLGREARRRATSFYLPTVNIPMFPLALAAGPLSLRTDGEASCALSVGIMLDDAGGIDEETLIITPSYVRTTRLTYDEVDLLLDQNKIESKSNSASESSNTIQDMESTVESLRRLQNASEQRLRWRIDGGSLESISSYELPDMTIKARPSPDAIDGWKIDIYAKEREAANRIVTELMLAANEAVALYGDSHGIPMPFRSQSMDELSSEEIELIPEGPCRSWFAILSTYPSQISPNPLPHAGLGLDMYTQATSPVRRYADLALHYQIKSYLRGDPLPFPGNDNDSGSGETMVSIAQNAGTLSRQLERPANDYWLKEFLRRRGTQITKVLVLSSDRWKDNVYKLLLPELGAICTYSSTKSLAVGENLEIQSMHLSELV
jgi:exoribonuclease-2